MRSVQHYQRLLRQGCLALSACCTLPAQSQTFTYGNITVLQAGDGTSALANTGNAIVLKEFSPTGALTYSMAVPSTSAGNALLISGSASSEGFLSLSGDKRYLVFGGYATTLPNSTALPGATASSINRGIGMVSGAGASSYSRVATSTSFFTGANIRGAAAANSSNFWGAGGSQGTNYFGTGAAITVQNSKQNLRAVAVFNSQLYCSSQVASGTPTDIGIYTIGNGMPVTNGQLVTTVINTGTGSQPAQFFFNASGTLCYVADQRNTVNGGIQKWVQNAGTWSLAYTLPTGTAAIGATGVVADLSGTYPKIYATTSEANTNRLIAINDMGAGSTATTLATASTANTVFRGLAFSPCTMPAVTISANTTSVCPNHTLMLSASITGSSSVSYQWLGSTVSSPNTATTVVTPTASGNYTLVASNACGADTLVMAITVHSLPAVTVNSVTICTGNTATLTASGANSYVWNNGATTASLSVAPAANTIYTVTGTNQYSCSATATTQVLVTSLPTLAVSSATACAGQNLTLTASGANTYSWNTGLTSSSIAVSPTISTSYTVHGFITGCPSATATATAFINALPTLSLQANPNYLCTNFASTSTLSAWGAASYTWSSGANTASFVTSQPGMHMVTGISTAGCSNTIQVQLSGYICEGIAEQNLVSDLVFYPNPASGQLNISVHGSESGNLEITNALGQTVFHTCLTEQQLTLNVANFAKGVYLLRLTTGNRRMLSKRLVIE